MTTPLLFQPLELRGVKLKNRIVVSPMCQYSAQDGHINDWHLVHLGKLAQGGAGAVFVEATAVERRGPNRAPNVARLPGRPAKARPAPAKAKAGAGGGEQWEEF